MREFLARSEKETKKLGADLARGLSAPFCVCLYGDLGSGKTVFAKGFAEGLGIGEKMIKSPTYTFVREYKAGKNKFYHFDFYRIEEADDLMAKDLEDVFSRKDALILIEWADRVRDLLPRKRIDLEFRYVDADTRAITIKHDRK